MNYEELLKHEKDLYLTVEEIFGKYFMTDHEYKEGLNEFKKHLKVYRDDE